MQIQFTDLCAGRKFKLFYSPFCFALFSCPFLSFFYWSEEYCSLNRGSPEAYFFPSYL